MTQPFEDIRERVRQRSYLQGSSTAEYEDSIRLLSAIDALMEVVGAVDKADLSGSGYFHVFEAMDALPPELKEVVE